MDAVQLTKSQQNRLKKCFQDEADDVFVVGSYAVSFCHLSPDDIRQEGKEYILELVMQGKKKGDDLIILGGALLDKKTLQKLVSLKDFKEQMEKMFNQMIVDYIVEGAEDDH